MYHLKEKRMSEIQAMAREQRTTYLLREREKRTWIQDTKGHRTTYFLRERKEGHISDGWKHMTTYDLG